MAGVSRQRTGIPGRDALDHHAARAALAVEVRLPAPSLRANGSARMRGEVVKTCLELHVIASAAKQSILSCCGAMDCFAALAMTAGAMDCFAEPVIGRAFAR